jgi:hypothetical protein
VADDLNVFLDATKVFTRCDHDLVACVGESPSRSPDVRPECVFISDRNFRLHREGTQTFPRSNKPISLQAFTATAPIFREAPA